MAGPGAGRLGIPATGVGPKGQRREEDARQNEEVESSVFIVIAEDGYILFRNWRNMLGERASDDALRVFDLTRECAMSIPEIGAGAIGLNMKNGLDLEFLDQWYAAARNGIAFRGIEGPLRTDGDYESVKWNRSMRISSDPIVRGHRHDQRVAGILAHRLGMQLTTNGIEPYSRERRRIGRCTLIVTLRDARDLDPIPLERIRGVGTLGIWCARTSLADLVT
jgi:hypothetical protein